MIMALIYGLLDASWQDCCFGVNRSFGGKIYMSTRTMLEINIHLKILSNVFSIHFATTEKTM